MRKLVLFLLSLTLLTGWFCSCETVNTTLDLDFGYEYYPQEVEKFIVYKVDSVIYDQEPSFTRIDTISFQVREKYVESFVDNTGETVYRIERAERANSTASWVVKDVWTSVKTKNKAERVEENLRFIKMIFPASVNTDPWDGNAFLDETTVIPIAGESIVVFKNWLYQYTAKDEPKTIGAFNFDSTLTVIQANEENLIELRFSEEIYARNIGMVKKEMKILDTQCISACDGQPWEQKAQKGFILRMEVLDHNW